MTKRGSAQPVPVVGVGIPGLMSLPNTERETMESMYDNPEPRDDAANPAATTSEFACSFCGFPAANTVGRKAHERWCEANPNAETRQGPEARRARDRERRARNRAAKKAATVTSITSERQPPRQRSKDVTSDLALMVAMAYPNGIPTGDVGRVQAFLVWLDTTRIMLEAR